MNYLEKIKALEIWESSHIIEDVYGYFWLNNTYRFVATKESKFWLKACSSVRISFFDVFTDPELDSKTQTKLLYHLNSLKEL